MSARFSRPAAQKEESCRLLEDEWHCNMLTALLNPRIRGYWWCHRSERATFSVSLISCRLQGREAERVSKSDWPFSLFTLALSMWPLINYSLGNVTLNRKGFPIPAMSVSSSSGYGVSSHSVVFHSLGLQIWLGAARINSWQLVILHHEKKKIFCIIPSFPSEIPAILLYV